MNEFDDRTFIEKRLDEVAAREYDPSREHPTPEQLMLCEAIKSLSKEQQKIWNWYAYDQLTQEEIGKRLNITQRAAGKRIATIEKAIQDWCELNRGAYMLLKLEQQIDHTD